MTAGIYQIVVTTTNSYVLVTVDRTQTVNIVAAGPQGPQGTGGLAATVAVGSTTTGAAGTNATVTNSGTSSSAILDFTIPRGATGAAGTSYGLGLYLSTLFV